MHVQGQLQYLCQCYIEFFCGEKSTIVQLYKDPLLLLKYLKKKVVSDWSVEHFPSPSNRHFSVILPCFLQTELFPRRP